MDAQTIAGIISLYAKHGWTLRRVLLSDALEKNLQTSSESLFGAAEIVASENAGAWFSRLSAHGEAWELRRLSGSPFALVEVFGTETSVDERERILRETERRMFEKEKLNLP